MLELIQNHDNEDGFIEYSIDYGPNVLSQSRERFASYPQARKFMNDQREAGQYVGVFYIYEEN